MKHIKLFESIEFDMIKTINSYNSMLNKLKPYVVYKYNMLVHDEDYEPEWESKPEIEYEEDDLNIIGCEHHNDTLIFNVVDYDDNGTIDNTYYVWLDPGEVEEIKLKMESEKYNL